MEVVFYTDLYFESLKLFKYFGSAVSLGFKDISDKANMLLINQKVLRVAFKLEEDGPEVKYIESLVK